MELQTLPNIYNTFYHSIGGETHKTCMLFFGPHFLAFRIYIKKKIVKNRTNLLMLMMMMKPSMY